MPIARVRLEDGTIGRYEVPEGMTDQEVQDFISSGLPQAQRRFLGASAPAIPEVQAYGPGLQPIESVRQTPRATGPWEAALTSTAAELERLRTGAQLAAGTLGVGPYQPATAERLELKERRRQADIEQAERMAEYPKATVAGTVAPYMAIPQRAVATAPRAIGTGFGTEFVGSGGQAGPGVVGGAAGGVGYGLGRALGGPAPQLTETQQAALAGGRRVGLQPLPSEAAGSRGLRIYESTLESSPLGTGPISRLTGANQARANEIAAASIGEKSEEMSDLVLGRAHDRLGDQFQSISRDVVAPVDDPFLDAMGRIEQEATGSIVATDAEKEVRTLIDRLLAKATDGNLSGTQITSFASKLRKHGRSKLRGEMKDYETADVYFQAAEALDDLLARNVGEGDMARLAEARDQWRNLTMLERHGVVKGGNVSPTMLANTLRRWDKRGFQRGGIQGVETPTEQLYSVARMADAFRTPYGSSGTAERLALPSTISQGGMGAVLGGLATGDPVIGGIAGLATLGVPALMSRMYPWPAATGLLGVPPGAARQAAQYMGRVSPVLTRELRR